MPGKFSIASTWVGVIAALTAITAGGYWIQLRQTPVIPTIALIPQTAGSMLWEVEYFGATRSAEKLKCHLYWNTPTSENDLAGQISLIDRVVRSKYQGLIVAPNHPLSLLAPLRRAMDAGIPVVIVAGPLDLPPNARLGYLVNDDEKMGDLAAREIGGRLNGKGSIALAGLGRNAPGVMMRARAAERLLSTRFPGIHIVNRIGGPFNTTRVEELMNTALDAHPELNGVLSFTSGSTRGIHAAIKHRSRQKEMTVVGCEQDSDLMGYLANGEIAAIVAENTYRMGYEAVELITRALAGEPLPARSMIPPMVITRQNLNSPEAGVFVGVSR